MPLIIGSFIAVPIMGAFDRLIYQKARDQAVRSGTLVLPEMRLYPAMLGVITQPISLFVRCESSPSFPSICAAFFRPTSVLELSHTYTILVARLDWTTFNPREYKSLFFPDAPGTEAHQIVLAYLQVIYKI